MEKLICMKTDTPSIMFSSLTGRRWGRTFRFTAILRREVDPALLRQAAADVLPHYPSMRTSLHCGLFWAYQTVSEELPQIRPEGVRPLQPITSRYRGLPDFRLTYKGDRVSLESAHSIGDGRGVIRAFEEILSRYVYLAEGGAEPYVPFDTPEHTCENAFDTYYRKGRTTGGREKAPRAFHFVESYEENYMKLLFLDTVSEKVKELAHAQGMTVTEFLAAVLILGVIHSSKQPITQPIVIAVPVDLRRFFNTGTLRNFTVQATIRYDPNGRTDQTLEEICVATFGLLKAQLTREELQKSIDRFGALKNNPFVRIVPYAIKKPVLMALQKKTHNGFSTIFTNLGDRELPASIAPHVERLQFVNGDTRKYGLPVTCSCVSCNGMLSLCYSRANKDTCLFDACVEILRGLGLPVNTRSVEGSAPPDLPPRPAHREKLSLQKLKAYFSL